ncbi:hypothetical protein OJAV_G00170400 [Oryzias javanicus]|uniref:DUF4515 domain-containing protein n=1 Tax=Oryzias javanicus TaxID=123683 RepID=A0A437CEY3_ORYJA|nr:hypothetical protein OJAV_G00170400 [Oryzias javanicus]
MTEEMYLTKIEHLQDQLESCQLECGQLEKQNKDLLVLTDKLEKDKVEASKCVTRMAAQKEKRLDELHDELIRQKENSQWAIREILQNHSREMEEIQQQIDHLNTIKAQQAVEIEEGEKKLMELKQQKSQAESLEKEILLAEIAFQKRTEEMESLMKKSLERRQERLEEKRKRDADIIFEQLNAKIEERLEFCKFLSKEAKEQAQEVADLKDKVADISAMRSDVMAQSRVTAEEKSSLIKELKEHEKLLKQIISERTRQRTKLQLKVEETDKHRAPPRLKLSFRRRSAPSSLPHWTAEPEAFSPSTTPVMTRPPERS